MSRVIIEEITLANIPVITARRSDVSSCPLVLFIHGFRGDKRAGLPLGYRLAQRGFFFVSLDAFMHGARFDERLTQYEREPKLCVYPPDTGLDTYYQLFDTVLSTTAAELDDVIEKLQAETHVETDRVGVCGPSMGGFITFYAAANNPLVEAAVPLISFPAFAARWSDAITETSSYPRWQAALAELADESARRLERMHELDPKEGLVEKSPTLALLMIQGENDLDAPKHYSLQLYRRLQPLYAEQPERLSLNVHDGIGHRVTSKMWAEAADWFSRHLMN